jgi:hypothetical protein
LPLSGKLANALDIEAYQLFYDETQAGNPSQTEYVKSVKKEYLEKIAAEFDSAIDKLKK